MLRKAVTLPVEVYSPERKAEFLLSTALDPEDYQKAREEVRKNGDQSRCHSSHIRLKIKGESHLFGC